MSSVSPNSQSSYPFLRRAELYISNVPEWRGGGSQAQNVKIVGDGTTSNLRIRFEIRKSIVSTASPTYIYVYNLSKQLRNQLSKITAQGVYGAEIELKLGWENIPMVTVFSGTLWAAYSEREGADIVTSLISMAAAGGLVQTVISQTFNQGASLVGMVKKIAGQIPGVTVGQINVTDRQMQNQGWTSVGAAKDCLDDLAKDYAFHYFFENGIFCACDDGKTLSQASVPVISADNGYLMRIEPILTTPMQKASGYMIQSLINPSVNVGKQVKVISNLNPQYNGTYPVTTLTMTGDTHGNQWDMRIESLLQGEQLQNALTVG